MNISAEAAVHIAKVPAELPEVNNAAVVLKQDQAVQMVSCSTSIVVLMLRSARQYLIQFGKERFEVRDLQIGGAREFRGLVAERWVPI